VVAPRGGLAADLGALHLSPGQQQLLALGVAALRGARVVLLDEVTGWLGEATEREVRALLLEGEHTRGCT
jgi:ABC-type lipoprotein export system ATPase subunit